MSSNFNVFSAVRRAVRHQHLLDDLAQDVARGKLRGAEVQQFLVLFSEGEEAEWMMFLKLGIFWILNPWILRISGPLDHGAMELRLLGWIPVDWSRLKALGWLGISSTLGVCDNGL